MSVKPLEEGKIIEGELEREFRLPPDVAEEDSKAARVSRKIALSERQLREADQEIEELESGWEQDVDNLRLRNRRRADHLTQQTRLKYAEVAHNLARGIETIGDTLSAITFLDKPKDKAGEWARKIKDSASSPEEIRLAADTCAIEGIINVLGEDAISIDSMNELVDDRQIAHTLNQHRTAAMIYRYHSYNMHDASESTLIFQMPLTAVGYRFAGPIGVGIVLKNLMNKAQASEAMFYQVQQMCTKMQGEQMEIANQMNAYTLQKYATWQVIENMRAAAAKDNVIPRSRVEFQNLMITPHDLLGQASTMRFGYEAQFRYLTGQWRGQRERFMVDLFGSLATGGIADVVSGEEET